MQKAKTLLLAIFYVLRCYNNQLTQLNLTANANLNTLDCNSNKLSSLNVSGNAKIERLNCSNNALTSLTFGAGNVLLSRVECCHNQLSTLNLEHLVALTDLYAENNQLPTLDFSHNTKVSWLKVQGNKIDTGMTDMIASLPSISSQALIYIVDTRNADEVNKCYIKHVVAAGQRGWITCDWAGGLDTGDMTGVFYYGYGKARQFSRFHFRKFYGILIENGQEFLWKSCKWSENGSRAPKIPGWIR